MQRLQQLVTAFSFLSCAALDSWVPVLQVSQLPVGGSRAASIVLPSGCVCNSLYLSMLMREESESDSREPCTNRTMQNCTWLHWSTSVNHSLVLEGWYRTTVSDCRCGTDNGYATEKLRGIARFVHGLRLPNWNASVSSEPLADGRLSVQVARQFGADADAGRVFFRRLNIAIYLVNVNDRLEFIKSQYVNCSGGDERWPADQDGRCSVVEFDGDSAGLLPGRYEVGLRYEAPLDIHRELRRPVEVPAAHQSVPGTLAAAAFHGRDLLLPLLLFLLIFLPTVLGLTWVTWRMGRRTRSDRAPADLGTVLLLPAHNRAPELDAIKTHLQKLGARTRDFQEWDVFRAFQSQPCVSAVLELPALREARIVFVCAGREAPLLRSPAAELWDSVLRFVRNWRPTELMVLTTAGGPGPETAGLAAARAFAVPGDLDEVARYLRETNTSGLPLPRPTMLPTTGFRSLPLCAA